eukprot:g27125.t1
MSSSGIEIHRTTQARQKLIVAAEAIATSWQSLGEREAGRLSRELRKLTTQLMPKVLAVADADNVRTFVSMHVLEELDVLTAKVHAAILSSSLEDMGVICFEHVCFCLLEANF